MARRDLHEGEVAVLAVRQGEAIAPLSGLPVTHALQQVAPEGPGGGEVRRAMHIPRCGHPGEGRDPALGARSGTPAFAGVTEEARSVPLFPSPVPKGWEKVANGRMRASLRESCPLKEALIRPSGTFLDD